MKAYFVWNAEEIPLQGPVILFLEPLEKLLVVKDLDDRGEDVDSVAVDEPEVDVDSHGDEIEES